MRLLAKLDRRRTAHPVPKMHGYYISADGLAILMDMMTSSTREERALILRHESQADPLHSRGCVDSTNSDIPHGSQGNNRFGAGVAGGVWPGIRAL